MSEAAASLGRGDADRWLAEAVIEIVEGKDRGADPDAQEPDHAQLNRCPPPGSGGCTSPASAGRACRVSRGSCWPGASAVSGSDATALGAARRAARARRAACTSGTRPPTSAISARATPWWCPARSARTTRNWPRRRGAGMRVMHRAAALASVMAGRRVIAVAGHARQDHHDLHAHHGAPRVRGRPGLRHRRRSSPRPGSAPRTVAGLDFVAEADESDGSFLAARRPTWRIITNVEADHLDNYGSLAEIEAAFADVRRPRQRPGADLRGRPGRGGRRGRGWSPQRGSRPAVRRVAGRRLPARRCPVPRAWRSASRWRPTTVRSVRSSPR